VAKGAISGGEAEAYAAYGDLAITQHLLAPLLEGVDGAQSLLITEYWPGRRVSPGLAAFAELLNATGEPAYAEAFGALAARIWARTQDASGRALYDGDLDLRNINVRDGGGSDAARAIDFGGDHLRSANEGPYWVAEMLRRVREGDVSATVKNMDSYLDGALEQLELEAGYDRASSLALFRRVRDNLRDPDVVSAAQQIQADIGAPGDIARAITILDAWLARQSQGGVVPAPDRGPFALGVLRPRLLGAAVPAWNVGLLAAAA
jgi:hypothetical protein